MKLKKIFASALIVSSIFTVGCKNKSSEISEEEVNWEVIEKNIENLNKQQDK